MGGGMAAGVDDGILKHAGEISPHFDYILMMLIDHQHRSNYRFII